MFTNGIKERWEGKGGDDALGDLITFQPAGDKDVTGSASLALYNFVEGRMNIDSLKLFEILQNITV